MAFGARLHAPLLAAGSCNAAAHRSRARCAPACVRREEQRPLQRTTASSRPAFRLAALARDGEALSAGAHAPRPEDAPVPSAYGLPGGTGNRDPLDLPTQGRSVVSPERGLAVAERDSGMSDLAYLSELMAIQQSGPRDIGFFGTRNMGFLHQQLIEILSYAMVLTENHIFTSGATGTNAAVIRGALRAERPDLLTVVLPQSLDRQPPESRELLAKVGAVIEMPQNDSLPLAEASRICNEDILRRVQQVICFAFHDSQLLLETCAKAKEMRKMLTLFYLD